MAIFIISSLGCASSAKAAGMSSALTPIQFSLKHADFFHPPVAIATLQVLEAVKNSTALDEPGTS
jgi:hypothetical protein